MNLMLITSDLFARDRVKYAHSPMPVDMFSLSLEDQKIFRSVVMPIAVNMMNDFAPL